MKANHAFCTNTIDSIYDNITGVQHHTIETNACVISNPACSELTCGGDGIIKASIRPDMFGFTSIDMESYSTGSKKLSLNGASCPIDYDTAQDTFKFNTGLMNCGGTSTAIDATSDDDME